MTVKSATVDSLDDLVESVRRLQREGLAYISGDRSLQAHGEWAGGLDTMDDVYRLARDGWCDEHVDTMRIVDSVVSQVDRVYESDVTQTYYDVAGSYVDMDAYMSGEPEHMVEFGMAPEASSMPVVTIVSSVITSASISPEIIKARGKSVAALVFALDRLGYNTEVWTDYTSGYSRGRRKTQLRCLVKGPNDMLDPDRILFGLAHPASTRVLHISAKGLHGSIYTGSSPTNPIRDMGDDTIYLPCINSVDGKVDPFRFVEGELTKLGIIGDKR